MTGSPLPMDALIRAVNEIPPDGLSERRQHALARFAERGFPTLADEDWKYTDLAQPIRTSREWLESDSSPLPVDINRIRDWQDGIEADWLVISNGGVVDELSTLNKVTGVEVTALSADELDLDMPLADLNAALLRNAVQLNIGREHPAERPLAILFADDAEAGPVASQARVAIRVEAGANAQIIEYHRSAGLSEHYSNALLQLDLAAEASCRWLRVQERALTHSQTARLDVRMASGSDLQHAAVDLGGKLARNDLHVDLTGEHASASFDGLYLAGPGQHIDNHTRVDHRVGPAISRQEYRGILSGRARAVWNGKAVVHKGADGTDATQANHNLLLSEGAEIDAKPELEIYADEVKCAHGTTVGQLDEKALYYLRTRGISKQRAKRILTRAFAATIVSKLPIAEMREPLGNKVEMRLQEIGKGETS